MTRLKLTQEARRIFYIGARIQHAFQRWKVLTMIQMIDLHAAEIDESRTASAGLLETLDRLGRAIREHGLSFDVHGIRLQAAAPPRLRETNGVEHAQRHAVLGGGAHHFPLA